MELRICWIGYTHCSQGEERRGEERRWGRGDHDSGVGVAEMTSARNDQMKPHTNDK
jgi:outer membrane phospholipase A